MTLINIEPFKSDQQTRAERVFASICEKVGLDANKFTILEICNKEDKDYRNCVINYDSKTVAFGRGYLKRLSDEELEFVCAHEIAGHFQNKDGEIIKKVYEQLEQYGVPPVIRDVYLSFVKRRHEYRSDRDALDVTGNLPAAISALEILDELFPDDFDKRPFLQRVFPDHPFVPSRINNLKRHFKASSIAPESTAFEAIPTHQP